MNKNKKLAQGVKIKNCSEELINYIGLQYPKGRVVFIDFIEWLKTEIKWNSYFQDGITFYGLPTELQIGMCMQFCYSVAKSFPPYPENTSELATMLDVTFMFIENVEVEIRKPSHKTNLDVN